MSPTKKLPIFSLVLISILSLSGCSLNSPAQKGYEKAKSHLKENLKVPNSFKISGAYCYYNLVEKYVATGGYPYQYKISYSAKNAFDITINDVAYYGYNDEYNIIKSYESDASKYNTASSGGKKQDIRI